jgi:acetolactate synthase-1/2/3 large subunit
MNGAESLIQTAAGAGIEVCFANPGTTEMHLLAALDSVPGVRGILGLFEGVCTGAADGFGRMADQPALTLLHLGPGFANGIANLHNARRARSPIVNLIGDHATWHLDADPPLACDIESLARPVSSWLRKSTDPTELARDAADAIDAARHPPGSISTLIVPADVAWEAATGPAALSAPGGLPSVEGTRVDSVARALKEREPAILLLGGRALRERGLRAAARIAAASGCRTFCETFPARMERGAGLLALERLPYFPEQVAELFGGIRSLILAGTTEPVAFFGYRGKSSRLVPGSCRAHLLARPEEDVVGALDALAEALGAPVHDLPLAGLARPDCPKGGLSTTALGAAVGATQPEGAIVVDEAATSGLPYFLGVHGCPPHSYLSLTGGAIGQGLPCATGAAIACPDRPVLAFQADGSGMYTLQSLWTQAREGLNVTSLICANRAYRILRLELGRAGIVEPGPQAMGLTDLSHPNIDWVDIGRGLGVPSVRAETSEALVKNLTWAFSEPGPHLIEAVL